MQHARRDALGELLQHLVLGLRGESEADEALARGADDDRAERRLMALEGDVDQPRALGRAREVAADAIPGRGRGRLRLAEGLFQLSVCGVVAHALETRCSVRS